MAVLPLRRLVLASGSRTRRDMLSAAGLSFEAIPAEVDEAAIRDSLLQDDEAIDPADVAEVLARAKAEAVSARHRGAVVIGADQILACDGELFSKPGHPAGARDTLLRLRGRTHQLHTAVVLAEAGDIEWSTTETAHLRMRDFSPAFVERYLAAAGERVCESVGAYQLEGAGIQLFDSIDGDYFTILGLPLLALLRELRARRLIAT